jgi:hypothetical protein
MRLAICRWMSAASCPQAGMTGSFAYHCIAEAGARIC